jgi:hypothetical protein
MTLVSKVPKTSNVEDLMPIVFCNVVYVEYTHVTRNTYGEKL